MRRWMMGVALLVCGGRAEAQFAVFDPTNYAENVLHYLRAIDQLRAAQEQVAYQVQALKKLGDPQWRTIASTVSGVNAAMRGQAGVGYGLADPVSVLRAVYPGDRATTSYVRDERTQAEHAMATIAAVLAGAHAQGATLEPGVAQVDQFKHQVGSVQGHEAALELGNSVGVFNAEELLLLRQAMSSQTNLQAVAYAREVTAEAQAEENARSVYAGMAAGALRRPLVSMRFGP